jgi:V/A-type H+-transporting ATPase subunit A
VADDWVDLRSEAMLILQEESELEEIVRLVGIDALSLKDRMTLETAKSIREDYLHQNAFDDVDTYTSMKKQYKMLSLILTFGRLAQKALEDGAEFSQVLALPARERIGRAKYIPEENIAELDEIMNELKAQMQSLTAEEVY